ncbi:unnamed protein product [Ambrosiozyma monospora]|uniref:Unnamed protein product n=1 Tax=Ambrosiozyma monospora TaxID=43982 RepID=A0ACB5SUU9_AMBMO|nr:unnamed protein product [Ambrosiozyma monospora]
MKYDVSSSPAKAVAEYVLELPTYNDPAYDSDKNPRVAAQSEMRYIGNNLVLVLPRDDGRGRNAANTESLFRHVDIWDLSTADNILGDYDDEGDKVASKKGNLKDDINVAKHYSFIDVNDSDELAKFNLHNGGDDNSRLLNEKWEGMTLIPVDGKDDEYYLLVVSDNDFVTTKGKQDFGKLSFDAGADIDSQSLIFHVRIPGLSSN